MWKEQQEYESHNNTPPLFFRFSQLKYIVFLAGLCCGRLGYLWLGLLLVLVEVQLVGAQHEPAELPVLHDAALFLQPASLERPLLDNGGGRTTRTP